jgi:hypothetical protein
MKPTKLSLICRYGLHHVIGAIYEAQYTGIREFRVHPPLHGSSGTNFTLSAFDFPDIVHLEAGKYFFHHLHKLQMNLCLGHASTGRVIAWDERGHLKLANLATLLSEAKSLAEIDFSVYPWKPSATQTYGHLDSYEQPRSLFRHLGFSTTWPRLRSFRLNGIYATEEDLIEFVARHKVRVRADQHLAYS